MIGSLLMAALPARRSAVLYFCVANLGKLEKFFSKKVAQYHLPAYICSRFGRKIPAKNNTKKFFSEKFAQF